MLRPKPVSVLSALVISISLMCCGPADAQTLRQAAERLGLLVGAAANPALFSEPEYSRTLALQFNLVEPENAMKWTAIEPEPDVFSFASGDAVVQFAEAHQMQVRGHNLLWSKHNPAWLSAGKFTPRQLRAIMKRHIQTEVSHYKGKVFAWDVVNEAFDGRGRLVDSIWYNQPGIGLAGQGTEYIAQAFRWAHQVDPKALLFYNDYAAEGLNAKSNAIYAMVRQFRRQGVPIDGVGLQMHIHTAHRDISTVAANMRRLARLGVQVQITEMDVGLATVHGVVQADSQELRNQADIYGSVASACAKDPGCTAFQTWGFTDKHSWIPGFTKGREGAALLFDANYQPKPAYRAVLNAFTRTAQRRPEIREERLQFEKRSTPEKR
jgi:endo-1,4-beta-xylanase